MERGIEKVCNLGECIMRDSERKGIEKGITQGQTLLLIRLACKKHAKGLDTSKIAADLEEDEATIAKIIQAAKPFAPNYDANAIYNAMQ